MDRPSLHRAKDEVDLVEFVALCKGDNLVRSKGPREMPGIKLKQQDSQIYELETYLQDASVQVDTVDLVIFMC